MITHSFISPSLPLFQCCVLASSPKDEHLHLNIYGVHRLCQEPVQQQTKQTIARPLISPCSCILILNSVPSSVAHYPLHRTLQEGAMIWHSCQRTHIRMFIPGVTLVFAWNFIMFYISRVACLGFMIGRVRECSVKYIQALHMLIMVSREISELLSLGFRVNYIG